METAQRVQFYRQVLADVKALPGVENAAYISFLPMVFRGGIWPVTIAGRSAHPDESPTVSIRFVDAWVLSIRSRFPLRRGRECLGVRYGDSQFVAVVSESFARKHWPEEDPLGKRFQVAFRERIVAGVVGDIKVRGLERVSEPQIYLPYQQVPDGALGFFAPKDMVIKASSPETLPHAVRDTSPG